MSSTTSRPRRYLHGPGQNDQPGIEHELAGQERMTREQFHSSVRLHAWIIERCRMAGARVILPHRRFNATTCPGSLVAELPRLRVAVDTLLGNP
jgi:hypothetical protein